MQLCRRQLLLLRNETMGHPASELHFFVPSALLARVYVSYVLDSFHRQIGGWTPRAPRTSAPQSSGMHRNRAACRWSFFVVLIPASFSCIGPVERVCACVARSSARVCLVSPGYAGSPRRRSARPRRDGGGPSSRFGSRTSFPARSQTCALRPASTSRA